MTEYIDGKPVAKYQTTFGISVKFIMFFLVIVVILTMTMGEKVATYFLVVVLLGMVAFNSESVNALITKVASPFSA
jgi:hypothetical protein